MMKFIAAVYNKLNDFVHRHKEGVPFLVYTVFYLVWFTILENNVKVPEYVIHLSIDDKIPFIPAFVIPYELWFIYVLGSVLYFLFTDKNDFYRTFLFLTTGMTIFLIVSTLWPNGQNLRPHLIGNEGVFERVILHLYRTDTPTNICPSIHVYNSLGVEFAVAKSKRLKKYKLLRWSSLVMCVLIILSTVFIKQHSLFDVITAISLGGLMYYLVYYVDVIRVYRQYRQKRAIEREYAGK